jgi:hypothetical protein
VTELPSGGVPDIDLLIQGRMMRLNNCRAVCPYSCVHSASRASHVVARCEASDKPAAQQDLSGKINEDVLSKLRAFEEENKKLKEQLSGSVRHSLACVSEIMAPASQHERERQPGLHRCVLSVSSRDQLSFVLCEQDLPAAEQRSVTGSKVRVDGKGMKREGFMFGGKSSEGSWLSESDVDFFTSGECPLHSRSFQGI